MQVGNITFPPNDKPHYPNHKASLHDHIIADKITALTDQYRDGDICRGELLEKSFGLVMELLRKAKLHSTADAWEDAETMAGGWV